jgi:cyclopropane fatty-acyl-phospholipid synthase-like methyltransferase
LVEIAKQNGFNVLQTYNLECFAENMFDLVAAFDVLEHIPQDKLLDFLTQIKRILKNDGVFIARFPNGI